MSDIQPENPYGSPAIYIHPQQLVEASEFGQQVADKLENGDTSPLPEGVLDFLEKQTEAINLPALAMARLAIANELPPPPYEASDALRLGGMLSRYLKVTAEIAVHMEMNDAAVTALFSDENDD